MWTSGGEPYSQFVHIVICRQEHPIVLNIHLCRRPPYCLVVAEFREKLSLSNREIPKSNTEAFDLRKLDVEVTEKCQIKISIKFVALEN